MTRFRLALATIAVLFFGTAQAVAGSASLVVDARTGRVLSAENPDTLNHPASLTKMMTLYMTFEALHRGQLAWKTPVPMSATAARKPPTKLGVRPGETITVQEAVYGMIVRSANDAAAAMAERLGGTEEGFARMMNAKARQLGMNRTFFVNASGLPASEQVTTARDMARLAVALMRHYPREYRLFSVQSFAFRGRVIRGHNNLMYRYQGMDGIKTGYTRASGYNLVSAVAEGNRRLIGVVLGGRSARSRDEKMAALLDQHLGRVSSPGRPMIEFGKRASPCGRGEPAWRFPVLCGHQARRRSSGRARCGSADHRARRGGSGFGSELLQRLAYSAFHRTNGRRCAQDARRSAIGRWRRPARRHAALRGRRQSLSRRVRRLCQSRSRGYRLRRPEEAVL